MSRWIRFAICHLASGPGPVLRLGGGRAVTARVAAFAGLVAWGWHGGQDGADCLARAGGRVGAGGAVLEVAQEVQRVGEFGQALLDPGEVLAYPPGDVLAWRLAAVADGQDAADVGEGQAGGLSVADECEPGEGLGWVVPVANRGRGGGGSRPASS